MLVTVRNSGIWTLVLLFLLVAASSFADTRTAASCNAAGRVSNRGQQRGVRRYRGSSGW